MIRGEPSRYKKEYDRKGRYVGEMVAVKVAPVATEHYNRNESKDNESEE